MQRGGVDAVLRSTSGLLPRRAFVINGLHHDVAAVPDPGQQRPQVTLKLLAERRRVDVQVVSQRQLQNTHFRLRENLCKIYEL